MNDQAVAMLVPIFGMIAVFGLPIGALIAWRYFNHKERLAMIEKGMMPPPDPRIMRRMGRAGYAPPGAWWYDSAFLATRQLRRGVTVAFIGIALTTGLTFVDFDSAHQSVHLGPWLLGGLVPLFVGLAQIVNALLAGASFRPVPSVAPGAADAPGAQPQADPANATATPPGSGPFGWRPGDLPEIGRGPGSIDPR